MSNGNMLSQEEIDALLKGTADLDNGTDNSNPPIEDYLSSMEQDALGEIGNISFGSSATALSTLLSQKVEITTPNVSVITRANLVQEFPFPYVAIYVSYTEGFSGTNLLVIKQSDASIIADLMLGGSGLSPSAELGEIQISAVQEAMNQMMGSAATSMSTVFSKKIDISPPSVDLFDLESDQNATDKVAIEDILVKISFRLKIGELIDSTIMQLVPVMFAKELVSELLNPAPTSEPTQKVETTVQQPAPVDVQRNYETTVDMGTNHHTPPVQQQQRPNSMPTNAAPQYLGSQYSGEQMSNASIQPAAFMEFEPVALQEKESRNLNMLLDIPLQVTVELGRTKRTIKEILELSPGSIIELDKLAGEPVDVLVNNKLIAKGEVVVIEENFGVRITDIISQSDRIKHLK